MVSDRKIAQVWQTWWSIVGPKLPLSEFRLLPNITVAPLSQEEFERMKGFRAPVPSISTSGDSFVVHYPPRDEIQSRHRLQIDVNARDEDEAQQFAQAIADRLLTSLSLIVPNGHYHAELRKLRRANEMQEVSRFSDTIRATPLRQPENIEIADIKRTIQLFNTIKQDAIAENAYVHLLSAWQLQNTSGAKPLERSVLQHYVLCMEVVVNGIMVKIRSASSDQIRIEERKFASEFAAELPNRADKPEAIRSASTKLREISFLNMTPAIFKVAPLLQLTDENTKFATELYRFRSSSLSHPGRTKKMDFDKWLRRESSVGSVCLADQVARTFFRGYCEYVSQRSN